MIAWSVLCKAGPHRGISDRSSPHQSQQARPRKVDKQRRSLTRGGAEKRHVRKFVVRVSASQATRDDRDDTAALTARRVCTYRRCGVMEKLPVVGFGQSHRQASQRMSRVS